MNLTINGEQRELSESLPVNVGELLALLGLAGVPVVVELNHEALLPREHDVVPIADGDTLEIVRVVAGG
jgi:thiamine biosynthesis protein ThiS